jgi:hypothetical protein
VGRAPLSSTIFLTFLQIKENAKTHTWISNFSKKNVINAVVRRIHQTGKKKIGKEREEEGVLAFTFV